MKVSICKGCRCRVWDGWHDECPECGAETAKTQVLDAETFTPLSVLSEDGGQE